MTENVTPETRFERKDIDIPPLLALLGGLVVMVLIACLVSYWIFNFLQAREQAAKASPFPLAAEERKQQAGHRQLPAEPHLEQLDSMQAAEVHKRLPLLYDTEYRRLKEYGWVDEKKTIVHIPIADAMNVIVEQKLLRSRPEVKKADKGSGGQP